ncbi:MAG TPA: helicase-related protein, partial [Bacillota bacterium]|nr:helicase-related protein [Bacillota bacterium]
EIIRRVRRGEIDILVGTHRVLSKDIEFKNLGLVIVDEEQRFGVAQKEKLKQLTRNVDVLTLTATPIPRTLNMAMSGIRDMSILEEAPGDRLPVQTYVLEYDDGIIAEALKKELRRGGQVFYLHNRVETIYETAARVKALCPEARVVAAHGKMEKEELSDIWQAMVEGEVDILVSTTIIETGVDVPNANTLVIEHADDMGLAQLHQIRGRVGRSSRRAYAYLTFSRGKVLSEVATKRLSAIRDYTEFGSGFKIAMRDLEIRGAGNLLGAEQHGHISSVGYDLYMKILNEAILEEKGAVVEEKKECTVNIKVSAYIPDKYIQNSNQRIDAYKKISGIENEDDLLDITDELLDRWGDLPSEVSNL